MNSPGKTLSVIVLLTLFSTVNAENRVIGTVEFELNGESQIWYAVDPGEDLLPTAIWLAMGPERGALSVAAYRNADQQLVPDPVLGSPVPAGEAEVLVMLIGFAVGSSEQHHTLPETSGLASIILLQNWSNPLSGHDIGSDPGKISLTMIDAGQDRPSRFAGSFNGVLRSADSALEVRNGRFELDGVPFFTGPD